MARASAVSPQQHGLLVRLSPLAREAGLALVGGTALALRFAHRRSRDIDLFSWGTKADLSEVFRSLHAIVPRAELVALSEVSLHAKVGAVPIDIVSYDHPPLSRTTRGPGGMPVASLRDLAAMKVAAINRRGIRRDFWDLHEIVTRRTLSLPRALDQYDEKYGRDRSDRYPILRSLTYFEDADGDPSWPEGLKAPRWAEIKADFVRWVPRLLGKK